MSGRVVHCKKEAYDIYVGRPTKWGNPFVVGRDGTRDEVIDKYRRWLVSQPQLMKEIHTLRGKVLACWCAPLACHADVLVELANEKGENMNVIDRFDGKYRFLSNFWMVQVDWNGIAWPSTEHAYQAAKTLDVNEQRRILEAKTPGEAKRLGRKVTLRPDWDEIRDDVMTSVVMAKFVQNPDLMKRLTDTHPTILIEGNNWGDTFWGVCNGVGENRLGKILMDIRDRERYLEETKRFIIAGTGSRQLKVAPDQEKVRVWNWILDNLRASKEKHGDNLVVMSGMAEGFDEAIALAAIELGIELHVEIPSPDYRDYYWGKTSLTGRDRRDEFDAIIAHATVVNYTCDHHMSGKANFVRNHAMVDKADAFLIYNRNSRGTSHCVGEIESAGLPYRELDRGLF